MKKLKRLRRGGLLDVRKMVIDDDDDDKVEESLKEEDDNGDGGDDDSNDEDWGKNAVLEEAVDGEEEEDVELEDEGDDVAERAKVKPSGKAEPRKRKQSAPEKVEPVKKSKSGAEVGKGAFKLSVLEPTHNSDSK